MFFRSVLTGLFASSRPLQAFLSIFQPLLGAFLALNAIPNLLLLVLLVVGSFAGMLSVFALNDLIDFEVDRKSVRSTWKRGFDVDSVMTLHPLSNGLISKVQQIAWIVLTGLIAAVILYSLNPIALVLFVVAAVLEVVYCKLALISELKVVVAGLIVSLCVLIGWFSVTSAVNFPVLFSLVLLFLFWEVAGRNIPNDFSDVKEDTQRGVKTIPSVYGLGAAAKLVLVFSIFTTLSSVILGFAANLGVVFLVLSLIFGVVLLVFPAFSLFKTPTTTGALKFFNKASLYPVSLFVCLVLVYLVK